MSEQSSTESKNAIERIVTRPDFDGVVCAVLLKEVLDGNLPVRWVQPNEIQDDSFLVRTTDVVANLPFSRPCALWFDHHVSNTVEIPFNGLFRVAPSAAGLVYEYYRGSLPSHYRQLVSQADKIDAAQLTLDEINTPQRHPFVLLSMTIFTKHPSDSAYCDHLVALLRSKNIEAILGDPIVAQRCTRVVAQNQAYEASLKKFTQIQDHVSFTDFRSIQPAPDGNRFLVYSLFPQTVVNLKVFHEDSQCVIKLGHSIVNRGCRVNVGNLLKRYGGGGHKGAGACRVSPREADAIIDDIMKILMRNQPEPDLMV